MRINHNIASMVTQGALARTNRDMSRSLERLSTGLRINRSSDDAAGLSISENLRTQVRGAKQAQKNAMDGISALQIAEGAANEISAILQRMRELAVQSSSDTLTSTERSYTNQEFGNLEDEIDRIASVTNYNGLKLLSHDANDRFGKGDNSSALWIDANGTRNVDSITVTINTLTTGANGLDISALTISNSGGAVSAISALDAAINSVNSVRSDIGAFINRLEHAVNNLMISETNQAAAESMIRDVDFAQETAEFTKNQILTQSATAMLSQANMVPSSVLTLLQ